MQSLFAADQKFWPPIAPIFDFTLTFEDVVMGIVPAALGIILGLLVACHVLRNERCIRASVLLWLKMVFAVGVFATDIVTLALRRSLPDAHTSTSLAATVLTFLASAAIVAVVYGSHLNEFHASFVSSLYLSLTLLLDATKSRSFFNRPGLASLGAVAATTAGLKLVLVVLEEIPKTKLILTPSPHISPETTSGLWSRMTFVWVLPLLTRGYSRTIGIDDINGIGPEFAADRLYKEFGSVLTKSRSKTGFGLAMVCFRCMPLGFLAIIVIELFSTMFSFVRPFILQRVIAYLQKEDPPAAQGNSLIGAAVISLIGYALTHNFGVQMSYQLLARIRGALVAQLFAKVQRLPLREAQKASVLTLMTADIQGIAQGMAELYNIPLSFVQAGLGMYLLSLLVSYSFVLLAVPVVVTVVAGSYFGVRVANAFRDWNEAIEDRVSRTSDVVSQLPAIKMHGLGPTMVAYLEQQRDVEIKASKDYRLVQALKAIPLLFIDIGTPAVLFAGALFWVGFGGVVSAERSFPALAVLLLIQFPLASSLHSYDALLAMLRSLERIQKFLHLEENEDKRVIESTASSNEKDMVAAEEEKDEPPGASEQKLLPAVRIVGATIAPSGSETSVLQNLDFEAEQGSLTAVVGAVGSGKSTFLQSIIGEADIQEGSVSVEGVRPIGYCDQQVWLRNVSIRENVIGPAPFDEARYDRVLKVCRLNEDIEQFPEGDAYIVGNNGSNLSGGQRQRLALARALFLQARLMILDDIFSALDHSTAMAVFNGLFGETGMLREAGCTTILATHLPECLDTANQVLVLDGKGGSVLEKNIKQDSTRNMILGVIQEAQLVKLPSDDDSDKLSKKSDSVAKPKPEDGIPKFDEVSRGKLYYMFIKSMGVRVFAVWLFSQFVWSVLEIIPDVFLRIWIQVAPANKRYYIGYATLAIGCSFVGAFTFGFYYLKVVPRSSRRLHQTLSTTVMRAKLSFLNKTNEGAILNKYSQDMTLVSRNLPANLYFSFYVFFGLMTTLGSILASSKWMAVFVVIMLIICYLLQYFYLFTSRQMRHLELESHTPLYSQFLEVSNGLRHIRAFGWEDELLAESLYLLDRSQKPFYMMYSIQKWLGFVLDTFAGILCVFLVVIAVHLPDSTSQAAIGLGFVQSMQVSQTMSRMVEAWTNLETSLGSLLRIYLFNDKTPVEPHGTGAQLPPEWPTEGKVEFKDVTARYNPEDEDKIALRGISFTIAPGQKVGLKGRTGSGKSSVLLTLLGFLEYSGSIRIDGVDIATVDPDELRSRIITISQNSVKFRGTVRDNLLPFQMNERDEVKIHERDDELQKELASLNLWDAVEAKGGLDAKLHEVGLSAGELQVFCIARAVLRSKEMGGKVVLVDEGTSSIDYETDAKIQEALKKAFSGCTVITIAHRTNTIEDCDIQIELSKGEIVKE